MIRIITHRGLDPSRPDFPFESTRESFEAHLARGYGMEFDVQRAADGYVVLHDATLARITDNADTRRVRDTPTEEILALDLQGAHIATLREILTLFGARSAPGAFAFIHLKHTFQADAANLDALLQEMSAIDTEKFILFDVTVESARYLKTKNHALHIAPSVAHPYDIKRYNTAVDGTLLSCEEALGHRDLFDWVWLDEWDLTDEHGGTKKLYTAATFERFRTAGVKIALVSPELHRTSPGLLGGEAHPDARDPQILRKRLEEIIALRPDAVCTNYPDLVAEMTLELPGDK